MFAENEKILTIDEMMAQVFLFFLAGFETTSSALSFALYEIAKNKNIQDKLQNNIDMVMKQYEGSWSSQFFNDMKYLDKVCNETLRMYPSAPLVMRRANQNWKVPNNDYVIRKNTQIYISIYSIHHDSKYYPNPECFDPERFSPENIQNRAPFTYIPFGEGPKHCIGSRMGILQVKIGIVAVLSKFRIELLPNKSGQIISNKTGILNVTDDVKLKLILRNK